MRTIKFRAWCKKDKLMYHDIQSGIKFEDDSMYGFSRFLGQQEADDYHQWELMQFTGLLDKSGKEIYEGDILNINPDDDNWEDFVVYDSEVGCFELNGFIKTGRKPISCVNLKDALEKDNPAIILGNIYENPVAEEWR